MIDINLYKNNNIGAWLMCTHYYIIVGLLNEHISFIVMINLQIMLKPYSFFVQ